MLVTNPRRPPLRVPEVIARWVLDGTITNWDELGQPSAPLRVVERSPAQNLPMNTIGIEVGHAVGPGVRVLSVEGVHPMRDPADYPIRAAGPSPTESPRDRGRRHHARSTSRERAAAEGDRRTRSGRCAPPRGR